MVKMKNSDFANKAKEIATKYKTLYIKGCFGAPMNDKNKKRYTQNNAYNKKADRVYKIKNASSDTFGFDCVCLIKGILWGWNGNVNKTYGGATYVANNIPDFGADNIVNYCNGMSNIFSNIEVGEVLHMKGHVGIYIGDGLAVECTPKWKDSVQITAVGNIGEKKGYNSRKWVNHGKLKYIDYIKKEKTTSTSNFLGDHGYFKYGDVHENIGKIAAFMRKTFPAYTSEKALGNKLGPNLQKAIKEFQKRTELESDGNIGPITLATLKKYGFKEN